MHPDQSNDEIRISPEMTPNPATVRFVTNRRFFDAGAYVFTDHRESQGSPLAAALLAEKTIREVLITPHAVSVTKAETADWSSLIELICETVREFLSENKPAVHEAWRSKHAAGRQEPEPGGSVEALIRHLLDSEIRPVIQEDGGDVAFESYSDGIVRLHLQGACRSCPGATRTLKMGIENYLKRMIPGIKEVVQVPGE
jgi:Fe-S cluster biogenesis protein NfuA